MIKYKALFNTCFSNPASNHVDRIIITTLQKKYSSVELHEHLVTQNYIYNEEDQIKVVFARQSRFSKKWIHYIEAPGSTFIKLVNTYANIGWTSHFIKEDFNILRCLNCQQYNHEEKDCKNKTVCNHCGGEHRVHQCKGNVRQCCSNCKYSNERYKSNFDIKHDTDSSECPVYQMKVQKVRERTNYDLVWL